MKGTNLDVLQMKRKAILKKLKPEQERIRDLGQQLRDVERRIESYNQKKLEEETGVDLYFSDDYAGLSVGQYRFYFGYEETMCLKHDDCTCENKEWCFTATVDGKEVMRIPEGKLGQSDVRGCLLHGIGQFLNKQSAGG